MSDKTALTSLTSALEKDFAAFCTKKGCDDAGVQFFAEQFGREAVIKLSYDEDSGAGVKSYAAKLKKQFGYISDGEGEEFAIDLVIPVARAKHMAAELNNPSTTAKRKKEPLTEDEVKAMFPNPKPPAPKTGTIVKEFYNTQIEMRGPDNPHAKPMITGTVCTLRYDDGGKLTVPRIAALFNEAAKDFPKTDPARITVGPDRLEVREEAPAGYAKRPPVTTGVRG